MYFFPLLGFNLSYINWDLNQKQEECNDSIDAWVENEHSLICFSSLSSELLTHFNCHNVISFSTKGVGSNRMKIFSFIIRVVGFPGEELFGLFVIPNSVSYSGKWLQFTYTYLSIVFLINCAGTVWGWHMSIDFILCFDVNVIKDI